MGYPPAPIGYLKPVGGIGPYKFVGVTPSSDRARINSFGVVSLDFYGRTIKESPVPYITFTVTDGTGASITKNVNLNLGADVPSVVVHPTMRQTNNLNDNNRFDELNFIVSAWGGDHNGDDTLTVTEPTGTFNLSYGQIRPVSTNVSAGSYPVHITCTSKSGDVLTLDTTLVIAQYTSPPTINFVNDISTATPNGYYVGTVLATTESNVAIYSMGGADAQYFNINASSGIVTINTDNMPAGVKSVTFTVTDRLASITRAFSINVKQGTKLSASAMQWTAPTNLDNSFYVKDKVTATVTGISGKKVWSLFNVNQWYSEYYQERRDLFWINKDTGEVSMANILSNRVHEITITCTDGLTTCVAKYNISVAWKQGPTIHLGEGMFAQYGDGIGFDHFYDLMKRIESVDDIGPLSGAIVIVHPNADPNYFAADSGNGERPDQNNGEYDYGMRFGIHGPLHFKSSDPTKRYRMGGFIGSPNSGIAPGGKGYFDLNHGDFIFEDLELSWTLGGAGQDPANLITYDGYISANGLSGLRKNGDTYGDLRLNNCSIHHCNNGLESGGGPFNVYVHNSVFYMCGASYQGSGLCHNMYIGTNYYFEFVNSLSLMSSDGHDLKSRAQVNRILNSRLYDCERGSASALIDLPNGGDTLVDSCELIKGPNPNSAGAIRWCYEAPGDRISVLRVTNNKFAVLVPAGMHTGSGTGVSVRATTSILDGSIASIVPSNNSFYLAQDCQPYGVYYDGWAPKPPVPVTVEQNMTTLALPFAANFSDPGTANPAYTRPDWFWNTADSADLGEFFYRQIDPQNDDIRIPLNSPVGTVVANCRASGSVMFKQFNLPNDSRAQPFTSGSVWELTQDPPYYGNTNVWAPVGKYVINATTGVVTLNQALTSRGVDFIKVRVTSPVSASFPNKITCVYRFYIVIY
jgi:hypothetical protein